MIQDSDAGDVIKPLTRGDDGGAHQAWYLSATPLAALPWLIRLRVITATLDLAVVVTAMVLPHADFPLRHVVVVVALSGLAHAAIAFSLGRHESIAPAATVAALLLDVALLTELLDLTGGPFNPFAVIYAVHVALAAVTAGRGSAWLVGMAALGAYGTLLYWHTIEGVEAHHRINDFPTHLFTMWVAASTVAELAAYFAVQASHAVESMRLRATRSERLVALTTMAAGAAHELSTPLATIAVAARELERTATQTAASPALAGDARLIRTEVERCRHILDQMSGRAGGIAADAPEAIDLAEAVADSHKHLPSDRQAQVTVDAPAGRALVHTSRAALRQTLTSLLANALDASGDGAPVRVIVRADTGAGTARLEVRDAGHGMAPDVLARAGEPFFTTKEPGRGLGLGLFLARVFAERAGGAMTIATTDGTVVTIELPLRSEAPGA